MLIQANHPSFLEAEKTTLTDPVSASATTLKVKNTQGFSNNDYLICGEIGTEKAEIVKINAAVSSNIQLTITATKFSHNEGDPVTYARYNQVRFYRATSKTGTYTLQTTKNLEVDNANLVTVWDDTTGASTHWYKISYYNDVSTLESSLSDPIPGTGIATDTVRYVTDEILKEALDEEEKVTSREEILDWLNDCQDDVKKRRQKWSFKKKRVAANRVASQETYSLATAFGISNVDLIDHLTYNYVSGTTNIIYRLRFVPLEEFDLLTEDSNASESDELQKWTWDEYTDVIRVYPIPDTSANTVFYLYYYEDFSSLDSEGDTLDIPDTRVYKYYALQQFYIKKDDQNRATYYGARYEQAVANLVRRQRKETGQPYGFKYDKDNIRRFYKY